MANVTQVDGENQGNEWGMKYDRAELKRIKAEIRAQTRSRQRQACYVCHSHQTITELHHLIPVSELARYLLSTGAQTYPLLHTWMCPNCHTYWHQLERASRPERRAIFNAIGVEESSRMNELLQRKVNALAKMYGVELPDDE